MNNIDFQNGFALGRATGGVVEVEDTTKLDELETLIDESGVLEDTEGSVNEKVEGLIDKVDRYKWLKDNVKLIGFPNNSNITTVNVDCSNITELQYGFARCSNLHSVYLKNTQNVFNWKGAFYGSNILYIIETLDFSSATTITADTFAAWVISLKVVPETIHYNFSVAYCIQLSAESIQSIIDGLATVETAQTLTLNSAITLTDEQKATINAKGWTLAQ